MNQDTSRRSLLDSCVSCVYLKESRDHDDGDAVMSAAGVSEAVPGGDVDVLSSGSRRVGGGYRCQSGGLSRPSAHADRWFSVHPGVFFRRVH